MFNWHEANCRRPDVKFLDGLDIPSCLSCGGVGIVDEDAQIRMSGTVPEPPSRSFDLCWPSSLSFLEDSSTNNGSNETFSQPNVKVSNKRGEHQVSSPRSSPAAEHAPQPVYGQTTSSYEPLYARKIRLLQLLPGAYHDPIRCKLRTVDLAFKPEYEALSYTWADLNGDTSKSERIYIGNSHDILAVTANCASALRRLRFPGRARDLWVDAICINQDDTRERSHQVSLMQYIYATAWRVLIYLGEDPQDPNPTPLAPWMFGNHGNTLQLNADIVHRPYFSRIWVIQEVAAARSAWVLYGSSGARWEDLIKLSDHETWPGKSAGRLDEIHPWLKLIAQPRLRELTELYGFLGATEGSFASDPRDKIFALLGLFQNTHAVGLVADYSLSRDQLCTGVTAYFLQWHPEYRRRIFSLMEPASRCNLPSWTIDWLSMGMHRPEEHQYLPSESHETGSRRGPYVEQIQFDRTGALIMKGCLAFRLRNCKPLGVIRHQMVVKHWRYTSRAMEQTPDGARRAQKTDEFFFFPTLPDYFVILRPVTGSDSHSFVGVCLQSEVDVWWCCLGALDERAILLFSTWNRIFGISNPSEWQELRIWEAVRTLCLEIRRWWHLDAKKWMRRLILKALRSAKKEHTQTPWSPEDTCRSTYGRLEMESWPPWGLWDWFMEWASDIRREYGMRGTSFLVPYTWWQTDPTLFDTRAFRDLEDIQGPPEVRLHIISVLIQACWNLRQHRASINPENARGPTQESSGESIFSEPTMKNIVQALGRTFDVDLSSIVDKMIMRGMLRSPLDMTMLLVGQTQDFRQRAVERLIENYELSVQKQQQENEGDKGANKESDEAEGRAKIVRWLKHSTGIEQGVDETTDFPAWALSLPDGWLGSDKSDFHPRDPYPKTADPGNENLSQQYRDAKSRWAPFLSLAHDTETYMLPLEDLFRGFQEFNNWKGLPSDTWRDICIV